MADSAEVTRRRMVIWRSIETLLGATEQQRAMTLWVEEFQSEPAFQPMLFLKRLGEVVDLADRRGQIRQQLVRLMFRKQPELGEPTADGGPGFGTAPAAPARSATPAVSAVFGGQPLTGKDRVFSALLAEIMAEADNHSGLLERLQALVSQRSKAIGVSTAAAQEATLWAANATTFKNPQLRQFDPKEMAKVIDLIYVAICDELGPPRTDRMFGRALRRADELPEARDFPPRRLF